MCPQHWKLAYSTVSGVTESIANTCTYTILEQIYLIFNSLAMLTMIYIVINTVEPQLSKPIVCPLVHYYQFMMNFRYLNDLIIRTTRLSAVTKGVRIIKVLLYQINSYM